MPNPLDALQKAKGIESADPTLAQKILEWATGYPASPTAEVGPADLLMAATPLLFHGTNKIFSRFDPLKANREDTLGGFVHFAETPERADQFVQKSTNPWVPNIENPEVRVAGEQIIPAIGPSITKILSLPGATDDDFLRIASATTGDTRARLISAFKANRSDPKWLQEVKRSSIQAALEEDPHVLQRAGYEAVRYMDMFHPAWAFPDASKLRTPWGTPLGNK